MNAVGVLCRLRLLSPPSSTPPEKAYSSCAQPCSLIEVQHGGDLSPGSTKAALGISATAFEIGLDNNGVGKPHCSAFFIVLITVQKEEKQEIAQISSLRFHLASRVPQQIKLKWAPSWLLRYHAELSWAPLPLLC